MIARESTGLLEHGQIVRLLLREVAQYWNILVYYKLPESSHPTPPPGSLYYSFPSFEPDSPEACKDGQEHGNDSPYFFIRGKDNGVYAFCLSDNDHANFSKHHREANEGREITDFSSEFDKGLQWMIFGHGGTCFYQFEGVFFPSREGPHENPGHLLHQVCLVIFTIPHVTRSY